MLLGLLCCWVLLDFDGLVGSVVLLGFVGFRWVCCAVGEILATGGTKRESTGFFLKTKRPNIFPNTSLRWGLENNILPQFTPPPPPSGSGP